MQNTLRYMTAENFENRGHSRMAVELRKELDDIDALEDGILNIEEAPLLVLSRTSKAHQIRQAGIQRIQKDMSTVNQLFKDLSGIVIQQGEMIRSVDSSVEKSVEHSWRANEEFSKTHKRHKEKQMIAIRFSLVLIGFIVSIFLIRRILFSHW